MAYTVYCVGSHLVWRLRVAGPAFLRPVARRLRPPLMVVPVAAVVVVAAGVAPVTSVPRLPSRAATAYGAKQGEGRGWQAGCCVLSTSSGL